MQMGRVADAEVLFARACTLAPGDPTRVFNYAQCIEHAGEVSRVCLLYGFLNCFFVCCRFFLLLLLLSCNKTSLNRGTAAIPVLCFSLFVF